MRSFLLGVVVILISAGSSWAIEFDIWKTGTSRQDMTATAKQHNIPLARDGLHHSNKSFNPALLAGDANSFYYFTTLLEHSARLRLHLSPQKGNYGQFLYEIEIQFTDPGKNRDLRPYLRQLLEQKYGPGKIVPDFILKTWVWRPENDAEVRLTFYPALLQLNYTDLKIKAFAEQLSKSTYDHPKKPLNHQDAGRF